MFSNFLVKRFIKDNENFSDKKVRRSYGYLGGIVGVIVNIMLFSVKLTIGLISNSIAVTADAFNNLSDSASSLITILGFKLASKPADKEHPFGHGRLEYISALIVSFLVLLVGVEFIKTSFKRILNPLEVNSNIIIILLMIGSILSKIWIGGFYKYLGHIINSNTLKASSADAFADVITSSVVVLSLVISRWTSFPIDGYIGILVALFIMYSGISLIKDTLDPLLGESPDEDLVNGIKEGLLSYEGINGVHDLIIHNYGPGRCMGSIHAEVPCDSSIVKIHEIIDRAEKELSEKLDMLLVIHMDPTNTDNEEVAKDREFILDILNNFPIAKSIHDFRVVGEGEIKNLIFDMVIEYNKDFDKEEEKALIQNINEEIKKIHPHYNAIITVDRDFLGVS